jgi:hypothetical protein
LRGLRLLGRGEARGEGGEGVAAHAGQPFIGEQVQCADAGAGAILGADRCEGAAFGADGVVPFPVLVVRLDR